MGAKAGEGVNDAVCVPVLYATVPVATGKPVAVSVKVEVVRVAAFIGSLKVAVTALAAFTLVAPLVGVTEVTVGTIPFAVVKLHV